MARLLGTMFVAPTALVGGTAQTLIQAVAPTNQRGAVIHWDWSFDGTNSANTPATQLVARQTTAGTATNTAVAPKKWNDPSAVGETLQFTYQTVYTVEPTVGDSLLEFQQPVFGGLLVKDFAQTLGRAA